MYDGIILVSSTKRKSLKAEYSVVKELKRDPGGVALEAACIEAISATPVDANFLGITGKA